MPYIFCWKYHLLPVVNIFGNDYGAMKIIELNDHSKTTISNDVKQKCFTSRSSSQSDSELVLQFYNVRLCLINSIPMCTINRWINKIILDNYKYWYNGLSKDINTFIMYIRSFGTTYVTAINIKFDIFHLRESKQSLDFYIFLIVIPILTMTVKWYI